ncbi:MAG: hypothetical protein PUC30_08220 [Lachnospiraceae bacterium]|nr:hypothetical protein [Lachnospiraceae bacterium]
MTNMCDALDEILEYHFKGKLETTEEEILPLYNKAKAVFEKV